MIDNNIISSSHVSSTEIKDNIPPMKFYLGYPYKIKPTDGSQKNAEIVVKINNNHDTFRTLALLLITYHYTRDTETSLLVTASHGFMEYLNGCFPLYFKLYDGISIPVIPFISMVGTLSYVVKRAALF